MKCVLWRRFPLALTATELLLLLLDELFLDELPFLADVEVLLVAPPPGDSLALVSVYLAMTSLAAPEVSLLLSELFRDSRLGELCRWLFWWELDRCERCVTGDCAVTLSGLVLLWCDVEDKSG